MWFKNLRIFRLNKDVNINETDLQNALSAKEFQPCGQLDLIKQGWAPPLGRSHQALFHSVGTATIFCAKRQEKVLPNAIVNEAVENQVFEIQETEGRQVGRAEKKSLKDEIIFSMLPKALAKSSLDFGYIDSRARLAIVNAASSKRAEDFLSLLRESLGSLNVTPITPHQPVVQVLTTWLTHGQAPNPFTFGEECELRASKDERIVRLKKLDLSSDEVSQHLHTGMHVNQLSLEWKESIRFIINEEFAVKRLSFSDKLLDAADTESTDSSAQLFDNEFAIMNVELLALITDLLNVFGGEEAAPMAQ